MKNGWETKKLGDVCSFLNRGVSPKYVEEGGIVVLNQRCIRDHRVNFEISRRHDIKAKGVSAERFVKGGDVLVNSTGEGTLGRVAQVREDPSEPATVDSHVTIVRPAPGVFFTEFFGYVLRDIEEELKKSGEGCGGQTELNRSVLSERFLVRFPRSLAEQQRIVGLLDQAFEGLATAKANAEKNLQNAYALFESHLQSVFTQRGPGWVETTLEDICMRITDGEHLRPKVVSSGVPFLSAKDVLAHDVVFTDPLFVSEEDAAKFRKRCNPEMGDILIVSRGATVGRTCVVKTDRMFCLLGSVILLKIRGSQSSHFISYALKSPAIRNQLVTASEAAAQQAIYLRDIKLLKVGCPPVAVQQSIVAKLDALSEETRRLARLYERKCAALEALKKSLLYQAFSGAL